MAPPDTATAPALAATAPPVGGTWSWIERLWSSVADRGRAYAPAQPQGASPLERARGLADALLSERGEASGASVARDLVAAMRALPDGDRAAFRRHLAENFGPDPSRLRAACEAYLADPSPEAASRLAAAAEPPRQELLRRMNMSPGGTAALVEARRELLAELREDRSLAPLDADLKHLLGSWFNRGFLELRRIDWQTPAAVLEKLIAHEAVHEIAGWDDLRRRLAADRRCFGFFHPALPGEPLIFVEVALTEGLASAVQPLLATPDDPAEPARAAARADTAAFYSISNCQEGLRGISFGNFLIKQVVEDLKAELPRLVRFSTLSPIPGFRRWLDRALGSEDATEATGLTPQEAGVLRETTAREDWWRDAATADAACAPLLRACARYLTRPHAPPGARGLDPVARFHLGNGARLERVNHLGNTARRGLEESHGLMANYLYDPEAIERNHEAFARHGTVARSAAVGALLAAKATAA